MNSRPEYGQAIYTLLRLLLLLPLVLFSPASLGQGDYSANKLLVLHDAQDLGVWRQAFDDAVHEVVTGSSTPEQIVRMSLEYTGVSQLSPGERPDTLIDHLQQRQSLDPAGLIVAVLPAAGEFLIQHGEELYPGVPKIYFATELGSISIDPRGHPDTLLVINTSLAEAARENLLLVPRVVPQVTDIYVLSGHGTYASAQRQVLQTIVGQSALDTRVHFLTGMPLPELTDYVAALPGSAAVLALSYEYDDSGNAFSTHDVIRALATQTDVPVFGMFDSIFGEGIVGGYMSRATTAGQAVGHLVLDYFNGEALVQPPTSYFHLFDDRQLKRLDIDRALLPEASVVEFESAPVWTNYAGEIIAALIVMGIQAVFIMALIVSLRKRRSAEKALTRQAEDLTVQKDLFESVINSIPDAVLISRVDRTIYAANKSTREVFGYDSEELMGIKVSELILYADEDQRNLEQSMLESAAAALEPIILQFKRKDGETFSGETVGTRIISSGGEVLGYFSLIRDVTRRLSIEQEQQQSQKMEALGTLVGGIAHDFNNVLGVISAYAELLSFEEPNSERQANIEKIIKATERGSDLCNQIMSFSRDMSVEQKNINLLDVAKETTRLLSATIPSRISLELVHDTDKFPVYANFTQMQQVILNLATNAALAIGEEAGSITITLTEAQLRQKRFLSQGWVDPGHFVVLQVADDGCGIPQEDFNRIFEPFYTTRAGKGTGMGLAMVYKIAKAHGGTIDLHSTFGGGTEISLYLPLQQGLQDIVTEDSQQNVINGNGERILLVDDELELLESVKRILTGIGYDVEAYSDAEQALASFRREPGRYDLLISDQIMPVLNGTHLLQSMRELRKDLPAILCTGYSEVLDAGYEHSSEISSIMRKPVNAAEISQSIERALSPRH